MYGAQNKKWKEIFGEAWQKVTDSCPGIGGFLIDHEQNSVWFDNNARTLTKADNSLDHDNAQELVNKLIGRPDGENGVSAVIAAQNEAYTAGFFKLSEAGAADKRKSFLPVCEISQLTLALTQNTAASLLALMDFKMSDGSEPSEYGVFGALTSIIKFAPANTMLSAHSANCFSADNGKRRS